ncbi:hypothetical protein BpHYR1_024284, partial [Brachionus plicatilis]
RNYLLDIQPTATDKVLKYLKQNLFKQNITRKKLLSKILLSLVFIFSDNKFEAENKTTRLHFLSLTLKYKQLKSFKNNHIDNCIKRYKKSSKKKIAKITKANNFLSFKSLNSSN